jgi:hypothetical protein
VKAIGAILFTAVVAFGAGGCFESDKQEPAWAEAVADEEVEICPSCAPNTDSENDGHDDGENCEDSPGPDVFCDEAPGGSETLYCVTCSDGTGGCYPYPADPPDPET